MKSRQPNCLRGLFFAVACTVFTFFSLLLALKWQEISFAYKFYSKKPIRQIRNLDEENHCVLPKYDPWNPDVMRFTDLSIAETTGCRRYKRLVSLVNRSLVVHSRKFLCKGRCISRESDYSNNVEEWKKGSETFDCDIVEVHCTLLNETVPRYATLLTQIIRKDSDEKKKRGRRYNVFVFLIDSMAASQAERNLPKTLRFLEKTMDSVSFPFVNKVGINSKPNGVALWFGKQMETIERIGFGLPSISSDTSWEEMCFRFLDNETSIFKEFRQHGYKTFLAEDWARGTLTWPNCYGYKFNPFDHFMRPFQLAAEERTNELLYKKYFGKDSCHSMVSESEEARNRKPEEPKFSWIWSSLLSHDYGSVSIRLDTLFYDFFIKNKKELDKSFVFLLGDHGLRFGHMTKTKLGALDVNNPMLTISIPRELRNGRIFEELRRNSKNLQTHYDTRATLLDILKYQPSSDFTDTKSLEMSGERGQSLLRKQKGERSCRTLPISFDYCICERNEKQLKTESNISMEVGKTVIHMVNDILEKTNSSNSCGFWTFSKVHSISYFLPGDGSTTFSLIIGVNEPYEKAQFRTAVNRSPEGKYRLAGGIDRVDSYGSRGNCVSGNLQQICDCKQQPDLSSF